MKKLLIFIFLLLFATSVNSYELEDRLKVMITAKIAKFISWKEEDSTEFVIGVYKNQLSNSFDDILNNASIKSKKVRLEYFENVEDIKKVNILYISKASTSELSAIFKNIENKNILTVSDIRGFAQKGGIIQLYSKNQKLKLRINLDKAQKENINIRASLLKISDLIRGDK